MAHCTHIPCLISLIASAYCVISVSGEESRKANFRWRGYFFLSVAIDTSAQTTNRQTPTMHTDEPYDAILRDYYMYLIILTQQQHPSWFLWTASSYKIYVYYTVEDILLEGCRPIGLPALCAQHHHHHHHHQQIDGRVYQGEGREEARRVLQEHVRGWIQPLSHQGRGQTH